MTAIDDPDQRVHVDLSYLWASLPPLGDWVDRAACADLGWGADVFTADKPEPDEKALGERTCRRCPVRQECALYAAEAPVYGLWAGHWYSMRSQARKAA